MKPEKKKTISKAQSSSIKQCINYFQFIFQGQFFSLIYVDSWTLRNTFNIIRQQ